MAPKKATRKEWIGLAVIALPCLLYATAAFGVVLVLAAFSTKAEMLIALAPYTW